MKKLLLILLLFTCLCLPLQAQGLLPADKPTFGSMLDFSNPLTDGLVFYSYFREAGTLKDATPYGNDGTFTGTAWQGEGVRVSSNTEIIAIPVTPQIELDTDSVFTWVFRVKIVAWEPINGRAALLDTRINGTQGVIFNTEDTTVARSIALYVDGAGEETIRTAANVVDTLGVWYTIAASYSDVTGAIAIHVNGVLEAEDTFTPGRTGMNAPANYHIGGEFQFGASSVEFLDGVFSDLKFYNRVLTTSEHLSLHLNPNQLIKTTPIWMFRQEEVPPEGITGSIFESLIFYSPIFGGSVIK